MRTIRQSSNDEYHVSRGHLEWPDHRCEDPRQRCAQGGDQGLFATPIARSLINQHGRVWRAHAAVDKSRLRLVQDQHAGERQMHKTIKAVIAIALIAGIGPAIGQGSAGTGNTSTGVGSQTESSGPGIRRGVPTQQPGRATNTTAGTSNLSPAQKNSIPSRNTPPSAQRVPR